MSESVQPDKSAIGAFRISVGEPELVVHQWGNDDAWLRSTTTAADLGVEAH